MSREVLGAALDDTGPGAPDPDRDPDRDTATTAPAARTAVLLGAPRDLAPRDRRPPDDPRGWLAERLDAVRGSRRRTVAALAVVAVAAGLVSVGVAARVRQAGLDRAGGVVAWLDYSGDDVDVRGQAVLRLNVVNTGVDDVTVTGADLEGGLEGRPSGVGLDLVEDLRVEPQQYAYVEVAATVDACTGPVSRGGSRDGELRVVLAGADLRDTVLDGARVGAFPVTSSSVVDVACGDEASPVVVESTRVLADERLHITLRGLREDVLVSLTAPDGIRLVTDPPSPVPVPGGQGSPTTTIAVALEVDTCTVSAQQIDAGRRVALEVGAAGLDPAELIQVHFLGTDGEAVVSAWVAREVTRACG